MVFSTSSLWEGRAGRWFISTTTGEGISQPSTTSGSQCSWCSSLQTFSSSTITLCWTSSISSCKNWPSKIVIIWNRIYLFTTYFQFKIVDRERNIWSYQKYDFSIWVVNMAWDCRVTYWAVLDSSKNWRTYCKLRTEVYLLVTFFLVLDKSINREP